jgi:SNF2 family DNA or RNA helicase
MNHDLFVNVEEKDKAFIIDLKSEKFDSLKEALKKSDINYNFKILSEIELLEEYFEDINDLLDKDKKITYTLSEFGEFYLEIIPILNILNFKVKLPQNLEETIHPKLIANMNSRKNSQLDKKGLLNLESLVDFNWKVAISDKEITLKEFKKLVKNSSQFIKIDNKCYIVDSVETDYISQKIKRIPNKLNNNQLLQTVLSSSYENNNVEVDESILKVVEKIKNYGDIDIPHNLNGVLRPYQKRGFSWLVQNILTGFGSILADDMGLGKTLQTLTTILHFKNNGLLKNKKVLVIAPTAILFNWKNEIEKFTPSLSNEIFHGQNRVINPSIDIIITSYGMIRTNFEDFENINWFMIVLDEAQNIKNPLSKQSQMVKRLNGSSKIALTGTPVENRLIEYWSIFDFCNKSYLEGSKNFKKNFVNPIEKDRDSKILERFKKITSPFILRRMKTDKSIIHDLPDKIVTECYCSLSKIQTALYQDIINKTLREIEESEGIQRKGLVFKLINSLKQICNHPSQFTQSDKFGIEESGKMEMLIDILENIGDTGENIIIFTQFVQMGNIIKELLEDKFKNDVLFYHGGLTRKIRDKMIEEFQTNDKKISKIMIVSLKAGGTGLNLTNASHVVHFDLWWNPAVEEQATDRVYRIGQKDNVFVYRFISNGTFEERINKMLVDKKELAEITIGAGENFVTEMSTDELRDLLNLKNN